MYEDREIENGGRVDDERLCLNFYGGQQDVNYNCIASCPANMYRLTPPTIESDSMLARAPPLDEADAPPEAAAAEPLPLAAENGLVSGGSAGLDWTVIILKVLKLVINNAK